VREGELCRKHLIEFLGVANNTEGCSRPDHFLKYFVFFFFFSRFHLFKEEKSGGKCSNYVHQLEKVRLSLL
jgi:hypothetical protein